MTNHTASHVHEIIARIAAEIAQAVRRDIADRVQHVAVGGAGSARAPAATPRAARAAARPARAPRSKPAKARRGVDAADADRVLEAIGKHPGLRAEQIQSKSGVASALVTKALARLRTLGAVKTQGKARGTTYTLAGAASAPAANAPKRRGRPPGSKNKAASATAPAKAPKAKPSKGGRRSSAQVAADDARILDYVKARPAQRSEQIVVAVGLAKQDVASGLLRLREASKVRMKGMRRGATYTSA